ncbi:hypothetical protein ACR6HW_12490 [Fusibacter sp. JL298sf-3]
MTSKYSVVAVAYKDITDDVRETIGKYSIRKIDEASDLQTFSNYGRQLSQDTRTEIYLEWYQKKILAYLNKGYEIMLLEIPHSSSKPVKEALNDIDKALGEQVLVIEEDDV